MLSCGMKLSMYRSTANRLGLAMMTVFKLGRRSSALLQKEKSVTYIVTLFTVFNLELRVFKFPSTFQSGGSAHNMGYSLLKQRVTVKCGYQRV